MPNKENLAWALLLIRIGLGSFLAMWAVDKIIVPQASLQMFSNLYGLDVGHSFIMLAGALELVIALFIILGAFKTWSYGLGVLVQGLSTILIYHQLLSFAGERHLFFSGLPILFVFIALFLVRDLDNKLCFNKK